MDLLSVTDVAKEFLAKSGYLFVRLEKADLDTSRDQWRLTFDVGVTTERKKTVTVDNSSAKVIAFE